MGIKLKFLVFLSIISCGCGSKEPDFQVQPLPNPSLSSIEPTSNPDGSAQTVPSNIASLIANDLLGGVFTSGNDVKGMTLTEPNATNGKAVSNTTDTRGFNIDTSVTFNGAEGSGKFVLSALGSGEENLKTHIQKYTDLTLRFIFHQYLFVNNCLGNVYLHGEISCHIAGQYDPATDSFAGSADCQNGPKDSPNYILYITEADDHVVALNVRAEIHGPPLISSSYNFEGSVNVDGSTQSLADLKKDFAQCKR